MTDDDLLVELGDALGGPCPGPSDDRVAAVRAEAMERFGRSALAAAEAAVTGPAEVASTPARPGGSWSGGLGPFALAAAVALVVGAGGATLLRAVPDQVRTGATEYAGPLVAASGEELGELEVVEAGIGRVVRVDTTALPVLPAGGLYQVWFVDADDPARRVTAGTFHPFADGTTQVRLAAAVDPVRYPVLEITVEPGDGDPAPSGEVVVRTVLDRG